MMRFHDTPDYEPSNARGIARVLREEIGAEWRAMHRYRREQAQTPIDDVDYRPAAISAARAERQLRFLLGIRREGIRG